MRNLEKILGYNSHSIGIIMKEIVRRVANAIREERFIFEKETKTGYDGNFNDLVTSADRKAQKIYIKLLQENFPNFGIIAEEKELIIQLLMEALALHLACYGKVRLVDFF